MEVGGNHWDGKSVAISVVYLVDGKFFKSTQMVNKFLLHEAVPGIKKFSQITSANIFSARLIFNFPKDLLRELEKCPFTFRILV